MRTRRDAAATLLLAALLVLSGCGVPSSGSATRLDKIEQDSVDDDSADVPAPKPSVKETTTVRNFLGAAAGDVNGRDKRLDAFVADKGKQKWSDPSAGVQLVRVPDDGVTRNDDGDPQRAEVTAVGKIVGIYGQNGQVKPWSGDDEFRQTFQLARETSIEEWHLTDAPQQVYLSDDFFADRYEMWPVYFPAVSDRDDTLVPDPRWVPEAIVDSQARYTQLTDWLLGGPSDWLSATVSSAFPEGTSRDTVTVAGDGQKVTVDVSVDAAAQPATDRETMSAQLAWTMGMTGSQTLSLMVDGQERLTDKVSAWSDREHAPEEDSQAEELAYFVNGDRVDASEPDAEYADVEVKGLREATINREGNRLAAVVASGGRQRLLVGPADGLEPVESFSSAKLEDLQWVDDDTVLLLDDNRPVTVNVNSGKRHKLSMEEGHGSVAAVALAPDARRLAYVAKGQAWVVTVRPDEDATRKLGDPMAVAEAATDVTDIGWSRETHLLLIGSLPGQSAWLWEASIDGAYLQEPSDASADTARADALAVRCKPAGEHGKSAGEPILLEINGIINRLYTEISPVRVGDSDATGSAPFTAP